MKKLVVASAVALIALTSACGSDDDNDDKDNSSQGEEKRDRDRDEDQDRDEDSDRDKDDEDEDEEDTDKDKDDEDEDEDTDSGDKPSVSDLAAAVKEAGPSNGLDIDDEGATCVAELLYDSGISDETLNDISDGEIDVTGQYVFMPSDDLSKWETILTDAVTCIM